MAWIWLTLLGAANAIILVTMDTLLQKATPDRFRGKVFGFRSMLSNGVFLISLLIVSEVLKFASPLTVFKGLSLMSIAIFFLILLVGYVYIWRKGVLDWGPHRMTNADRRMLHARIEGKDAA